MGTLRRTCATVPLCCPLPKLITLGKLVMSSDPSRCAVTLHCRHSACDQQYLPECRSGRYEICTAFRCDTGITAAPNESEVQLNLCLQEQTKQAGKKENGHPKRVLCSDCNKKRVMFVLLYVKKLTPVS